jgi:hypothetical protein
MDIGKSIANFNIAKAICTAPPDAIRVGGIDGDPLQA